MADYYSPTVVQPEIPLTDLTPLELLVLTSVFSADVEDGKIYLYSEDGPSTQLSLTAEELRHALQASAGHESQLPAICEAALDKASGDTDQIDVDLSGTSYEYVLQDIVRRSKTLPYITVVTSFTCSKMRADGFGGCATLITPDVVEGGSTHTFLEELIAAHGLDASSQPSATAASEEEDIKVSGDG